MNVKIYELVNFNFFFCDLNSSGCKTRKTTYHMAGVARCTEFTPYTLRGREEAVGSSRARAGGSWCEQANTASAWDKKTFV